jgi:hypothetical protein
MKSKLTISFLLAVFCIAALVTGSAAAQGTSTGADRTVLPPPVPVFTGKIGMNYKESTPDWTPALPLTAPKDAPNVLLIVLDDVGYGHLNSYGGPIETPTARSRSAIPSQPLYRLAWLSPSLNIPPPASRLEWAK